MPGGLPGGMEGSVVQSMLQNPEVLRSMLQANPAINEVLASRDISFDARNPMFVPNSHKLLLIHRLAYDSRNH